MALQILGLRSRALHGYTNFHQRCQITRTRPPSSVFSKGRLQRKKELKLTQVLNQSDLTTAEDDKYKKNVAIQSSTVCGCGFCNRRQLIGALGSIPPFTLYAKANSSSSDNSDLISNALEVLNEVHPPRPAWYEKFYAYVSDKGMKSYEEEVAKYKAELLNQLKGRAERILELGIGTGPNIKYYASGANVSVVGIDPNMQMEKYARAAATAVGIPESQFKFIRGVGEALPVLDSSMDAVVGTLVLCSVSDVRKTLKEVQRVLKPSGQFIFVEHVAAPDGTLLRFWQKLLDPLQQFASDGCHLTRETGKLISESGFSKVIQQDDLEDAPC
ncbi:hypothetical protein SUGI_1109200 [Cryptomeria japonica]|nr:hypothetical protein SUGI_1109200 [Cryptomeria japonica]